MKLRLPVLIAAVLLGTPLASHADVPSSLNQVTQVAHVFDGGSPHMSAEQPHAAAAATWIDSRMAREWWKDN